MSLSAVASIDIERRIWRVVRFLARCAMRPSLSFSWISAIYSSQLSEFIHANPRILLKPYRHYICRHFSFAQRVDAILGHYEMATERMSAPIAHGLLAGSAFTVAQIVGKPGAERYNVTLVKTGKYDREGELCLSLCDDASGTIIYRLICSLGWRGRLPCITIGCMQGERHPDAKSLIKQATKAMHGIRPGNLLVDAAYALANACGVVRVLGVANEAQVFQGDKVHFNYDAFWSELGGIADGIGFYVLPEEPKHGSSGRERRHRAEYQRRSALREHLDEQIHSWAASNN